MTYIAGKEYYNHFLSFDIIVEKRGEEMMEERRVTCPCKRISCPRHGDCASCRAHHHTSRRNGFTWCEKLERKQQKEKKNNKRKDRIRLHCLRLASLFLPWSWAASRLKQPGESQSLSFVCLVLLVIFAADWVLSALFRTPITYSELIDVN